MQKEYNVYIGEAGTLKATWIDKAFDFGRVKQIVELAFVGMPDSLLGRGQIIIRMDKAK